MTRTCGGCTKCCETVPVKELGLPQYTRCPHLNDIIMARGPGCSIYPNRPNSCRSWSCHWLKSDLPEELRPDRCGVIVDELIDMISMVNNETGKAREMTAAQIWVLPGYEESYRTELIGSLILALIDKYDAVLWRMRDGTARTFLHEPGTGKLGMTPPTMSTPEGEHSLGSTGERLWRAQQLMQERNSMGERHGQNHPSATRSHQDPAAVTRRRKQPAGAPRRHRSR